MKTLTLTVSLLAALAAALLAQAPRLTQQGAAADAPGAEPPLRARVVLGDDVYEVALGGDMTLPDGRVLAVELLDTRHFDVAGAFSFDYPRDWSFIGTHGVPTWVDAWWSLSGDGAAVYLRRHGGDADAIREEYLGNLELMQGGTRAGATLVLGGRTLEGGVVTYASPAIGVGYQSSNWEQRVFSWQEREGVAWLLTFHKQTSVVDALDPLGAWSTFEIVLEASEQGEPIRTEGPVQLVPPQLTELEALLASFRWH